MHAFTDPGKQNKNFPFATPAIARDCKDDDFIFWYEIARNISPKPSITLSNNGAIASGVPSRPVIPVPPVVRITSTFSSEIHLATY